MEVIMKKIRKPIFIIGCPRSGTGILQNTLRFHPEIAWVTPITNAIIMYLLKYNLDVRHRFKMVRLLDSLLVKFPDSALPKLLRGPYDGFFENDNLPKAVEDGIIWGQYESYEAGHAFYMNEKDVTPEKREFIQKVILYHLEYFGAERFLSKKPSNSLRIRFINEIFSDSIFIHLIRDGRAVANSLLERKQANKDIWAGTRPVGWDKMLDKPPIMQYGWQWKTVVETIERDANMVLNGDRFIVIKYEDLMENPAYTLQNIFEFCDLDYKKVRDKIDRYAGQFENKNYKWKRHLTKRQKQLLIDLIGHKLREYGYSNTIN